MHTYVCLAGIPANLWEEQIHTERRVLILEVRLEDLNLRPELLWGVVDTADDAKPASAVEESLASGSVFAEAEALTW